MNETITEWGLANAKEKFSNHLTALFANLLLVARGRGKAHEVADQLIETGAAALTLRTAREFAAGRVSEAVSFSRQETRTLSARAFEDVLKNAATIIAYRLGGTGYNWDKRVEDDLVEAMRTYLENKEKDQIEENKEWHRKWLLKQDEEEAPQRRAADQPPPDWPLTPRKLHAWARAGQDRKDAEWARWRRQVAKAKEECK